MKALYWKRPTAAEAAELGCKPDDYTEPVVEVSEKSWAALDLFSRFSTQWRVGPSGPVGLDYAVIQHELERVGVPRDAYTDLMDRLRIIERAALDFIHKE